MTVGTVKGHVSQKVACWNACRVSCAFRCARSGVSQRALRHVPAVRCQCILRFERSNAFLCISRISLDSVSGPLRTRLSVVGAPCERLGLAMPLAGPARRKARTFRAPHHRAHEPRQEYPRRSDTLCRVCLHSVNFGLQLWHRVSMGDRCFLSG